MEHCKISKLLNDSTVTKFNKMCRSKLIYQVVSILITKM